MDYARSRLAAKRGAGAPQTTLGTKMALPQSEKEQAVDPRSGLLSAFQTASSGTSGFTTWHAASGLEESVGKALHSKSWLRRCKLVE